MKFPATAMMSLAAVARRCDISAARARRLVDSGLLRPDLSVGRVLLFDHRRLPELRAVAAASAAEVREISAEIIREATKPYFYQPTNQPQ